MGPSQPGSGTAPPPQIPPTQGPPPYPWPYPAAPYYPPRPPHRDNVLLIVLVVVAVLGVAFATMAAWFFFAFAGDFTPPTTTRPILTFASPSLGAGNATVSVASVSLAVGPTNYRVTLQVGTSIGSTAPLPATSGTAAGVVVASILYRVYWTDIGGEGTVNGGDTFRITGNNVALGSGSHTFYLLWSDGNQIQTASFQVP